MRENSTPSSHIRIGAFALHIHSGELHSNGFKVKLQEQPRQILAMLIDRPGEVVTREELRRKLWPEQTFVDFDCGLNKAVMKLREAFGDDADNPRYIETLPRRGYRFIAPVETVAPASTPMNGDLPTQTAAIAIPSPLQAEAAAAIHTQRPQPTSRWALGYKLAAAGFAAVVIAGSFAYLLTRPSRPPRDFDVVSIARLTASGKVGEAAISPDGRYIAYMEEDSGKRGIWLRQVATADRVRIIEPEEWNGGLSFSPDNNYLYFLRYDMGRLIGILYRVPLLGGHATKVVEDLDSAVTFSPDGRRIAYARGNLPESEYQLITANADGTGAKKLAGRKTPGFLGAPDWSPDGKLLAAPAGNFFRATVIGVNEDGSEIPLTSMTWPLIVGVAWLRNGKGLIVTAREQAFGASQIWLLDYPSGHLRRITSDLNDYGNMSLTGDCSTLVTVQGRQTSNVWIAASSEPSRGRQVTTERNDNISGLAWTPDNKIVCASDASGKENLWIMEADGSSARQFTTESSDDVKPAVSPDGRYVVFISDRTGVPHVWRIDIDGRNPRQLSNGTGEFNAKISPDGRWVVYSRDDPRMTVWKVPIDGGDSVQLTEKFAQYPTVSPDGKLIACAYLEDPAKPWRLAVIPSEGGQPTKWFDIPHGSWRSNIHWTLDGRAIAYAKVDKGVSNIWLQPLAGGPPKQLTRFTSDLIFDFAWSQDGKQLALARGNVSSDAVLIRNFQ